MKRKTASLAAVLVLAAAGAYAFQVESLTLHLHLAGLHRTEPPRVQEGYLVLTAEGTSRHVGASFAHEGFRTVHSFERNAHGIFVLVVPVPYEIREPLRYRLVVDGIWGRDPSNPETERDPRTGAVFSLARVPYISTARPGVWRIVAEDGRTVRFRLEAESGQTVAVVGDFNAWDPFVHELHETSPGIYELSLPLPSGEHRYVFLVGGDRVPDPLNRERLFDPAGRPVSIVRIR